MFIFLMIIISLYEGTRNDSLCFLVLATIEISDRCRYIGHVFMVGHLASHLYYNQCCE